MAIGVGSPPYGSIQPRAWGTVSLTPSLQSWVEKHSSFMLGCRMSQAPASMTTFEQFQKNTGKGLKEYKDFCDGQLFDMDLRRQLGEPHGKV